jgi:hypothetical protein
MTPRLRPCGNPDCRICAFNMRGEPPAERPDFFAENLLGAAALILFFVFLVMLLPVLMT